MTPIELEKEFEKDFKHLKRFGLELWGVGRIVKGNNDENLDESNIRKLDTSRDIISIRHPFIFDNRQIPDIYKGFKVQNAFYGDDSSVPITHPNYFPPEFDIDKNDNNIPLEIYWEPNKFIAFVNRCENEIKKILDNPNLTKPQMLDILAFGSFEKHIEQCKEWKRQRDSKTL